MLKQASLAPWDLDMHLPWQVFMSPLEKWAAQPSFLIGEYLFYAVALTGLWLAPFTMITGLGLIGWRAKARSKASSSPATEIVPDTSLAQ